MLKNKLKDVARKVFSDFYVEQEKCLMLAGGTRSSEVRKMGQLTKLSDAEFSVYSQWGEDGIIQYLISHLPIENQIFIEFGVQDYTESNTRFLLKQDNWSGLVMDGSDTYINVIRNDNLYWRHDLTAIRAFITKENINELISKYTKEEDIGLLSIDIDGNDYWVWKSIECVKPRIVVCEYNSLFGPELAVSVPYNPNFVRSMAHYSNIYYGASLKALNILAEQKGYVFIGTNSAGNNAFYVRLDVLSDPSCTINISNSEFNEAKFRETRTLEGELSFIGRNEKLKLIRHLSLVDILTNRTKSIEEFFNLS